MIMGGDDDLTIATFTKSANLLMHLLSTDMHVRTGGLQQPSYLTHMSRWHNTKAAPHVT